MRQVEVSRTLVFDAPRHARGVLRGPGRRQPRHRPPRRVELIFRRAQRRGRPASRLGPKTKVVTRGTEVTVNAFYKHSRIKQYLKDGRALRIETVINSTQATCAASAAWSHLDELQARARAVNRRLLDTERVGQGCVLASPAFERIAQPTLTEDGRRAPALRFGDPRVQALAGALCTSVLAVTGITNKSLRALMTGLLGGATTPRTRPATTWPGSGSTGSSPASRAATATGSPTTGCGSRSSTPSSTTGCCAHCSPPTSRPLHHRYEKRCTPSIFTSQNPSNTPDCPSKPPENSRQLSKF